MYFVDKCADTLYLDSDIIPIVEHDLGVAEQAYAGASTSHDDGASLQGCTLTQEGDRR